MHRSGHFLLLSISLTLTCLLSANPRDRTDQSKDKTELFPGTGFFIRNYEPYEDAEAAEWYRQAVFFEKSGRTSDALKLFEKFTKRRSDHVILHEGAKVSVGADALYRAAMIRERKGDWKKAFDHLLLVAKAYMDYDFEKTAQAMLSLGEKLAKQDLPKKWGFVPRFRSASEDRARLYQIADIAKGPQFAPRALMISAEISIKDELSEEAVDALERLINLYPRHPLSEKAYFLLAEIHASKVAGPLYDQGVTRKSRDYYDDYIETFYDDQPARSPGETLEDFLERVEGWKVRRISAKQGRAAMTEMLASSKLELGEYVEKYGRYFMSNWQELSETGGNPSLRFYYDAEDVDRDSEAGREARKRIDALKMK